MNGSHIPSEWFFLRDYPSQTSDLCFVSLILQKLVFVNFYTVRAIFNGRLLHTFFVMPLETSISAASTVLVSRIRYGSSRRGSCIESVRGRRNNDLGTDMLGNKRAKDAVSD